MHLHFILWTHLRLLILCSACNPEAFPLPTLHYRLQPLHFILNPVTGPLFLWTLTHKRILSWNSKQRMGKLLRAEPEGPKYLEGFPQPEAVSVARNDFRSYHHSVFQIHSQNVSAKSWKCRCNWAYEDMDHLQDIKEEEQLVKSYEQEMTKFPKVWEIFFIK